jgi:hypothetical protein
MSPKQRNYLIVVGCIGPAVANAFFNGLVGWGITFKIAKFSVWAIPGVAVDLVATAGGVALGTCIAMILQVKMDFKRGKISAPPSSARMDRLLAPLPNGMFKQSIWVALVCVPLFAFPVMLVLLFGRVSALDRVTFTLLKGGLSALESALIAPLIVLRALADLSGKRASDPPFGVS